MELNEGLKKIFLAGVGAVATTAETAKDVVENLVKKGELTVEQGKVLNEELKRNAKEKLKEHVSVTVVKEYKDAMSAVEHMPADELEALKAKIAEVEKAAAGQSEPSDASACNLASADVDSADADTSDTDVDSVNADSTDEDVDSANTDSTDEDVTAADING